ncbi:DUF4142 domain-containing protein [Roseomonas sp. BN140053]|uniref:DUF4142 domain-containing protein n=1 Tax=Roseomonas sp. BN140053 TaxID=3391898 RepID=UPI0039E7FAC8
MLERRSLGLVLAGLSLAGCATSAVPNASSPQALAGAPPPALRLTALQGGTFLLQTAQLGATKAQRPELQRFSEFEASEQQGIMQAMALAGHSVAPPPLPPEKAAMLQQLQAAGPGDFDRLFIAAQTQGHQEALPVYTAIAQSTASPAADRSIALLAADRIREHIAILEFFASMPAQQPEPAPTGRSRRRAG